MSERSRNIAVGLTVIVAMGILGLIILVLTGLPSVFQRGWTVKIQLETSAGVKDGEPINLAGVRVGTITEVGFTDPTDPSKGVTLTGRIDPGVKIRSNSAFFVTRDVLGRAYAEIKIVRHEKFDPATGLPWAMLPTDGSAVIPGSMDGGAIMEELKPAIDSLTRLADNINALVAPAAGTATSETGPTTAATQTAETGNLRGVIARLDRTLAAVETVFGDQQNQANIKSSLANFATAAAQAGETMESVRKLAQDASVATKNVSQDASGMMRRADELAGKLIGDAEQVSAAITTLNRIVTKMDQGEGSAGKMLNDPQLYNGLVEATKELSRLVKDARELVETWKTSGVNMKLK